MGQKAVLFCILVSWSIILPQSQCEEVNDCFQSPRTIFEYVNSRYATRWTLAAEGEIEIEMKAQVVGGWVGVGWGVEEFMDAGIDMVVGSVHPASGEVLLSDRFSVNYLVPTHDRRQDVHLLQGAVTNGWTEINFRRKILTGDEEEDVNISDAKWLLVAWGRGLIEGVDGDFLQHEEDFSVPFQLRATIGVSSNTNSIPNTIDAQLIAPTQPVPASSNIPRQLPPPIRILSSLTDCFEDRLSLFMLCWSPVPESEDKEEGAAEMEFTMRGAIPKGWVAVGFSRDDFMPQTDMVIASYCEYCKDRKIAISDRWATSIRMPLEDSQQDITLTDAQVSWKHLILF